MQVLILNSTGFSDIGWVTEPATQKILADSLTRTGLEVSIAEVASAAEVDQLLLSIASDTLVWPNAYYVYTRAGGADKQWLTDILEAAGVPFVGSPATALRAMLHKDVCQARLASAGLPVPRFTTVTQRDTETVRTAIEAADLSWPMVVKPTSSFDSLGISVVTDIESLTAQIGHILDTYGPRAIIEEYLPSTDITVGVLMRGAETTLLTTWYEMTDRDGILDHPTRLMPWGGPKQMREVKDPGILEQVEAVMPRVAEELEIRDFTRVDGRLDDRGVLRIFDVNGMPSLDYPHTVTLRQVTTVWDEMDTLLALDRLVATLVASAAERYDLEAPSSVAASALPINGPSVVHVASIGGLGVGLDPSRLSPSSLSPSRLSSDDL